MKILVACEESQAVTIELRKLGHEAYSCDIIECSGGHPEWHIRQDVLPLLNGNCTFETTDGQTHKIEGKWDMLIAFPPCTYLTSAGTRHYSLRMNPEWKVKERIAKRDEAVKFFLAFANADCTRIAIENPVGHMNTNWRKPNQIIHPYFFAESEGDDENYVQKRTCLWLKGLPTLERVSDLQKPQPKYICQGEKCKGKAIGWCEGIKGTTGGQAGRAKARSKTFPGIAKAMAAQWAGYAEKLGEWIDWPNCEYVCSVCGRSSGCVKALDTCPNCGSAMRTDDVYPNFDCFVAENGVPSWWSDYKAEVK